MRAEWIQNTQEIKRTLFNWTKQDKMCKFSRMSSFSSYAQHKNRKFASFVLFCPVEKHSFNLLCVLDLFSQCWQSTLFQKKKFNTKNNLNAIALTLDTNNSSRNTNPWLPQLAEPLQTDPWPKRVELIGPSYLHYKKKLNTPRDWLVKPSSIILIKSCASKMLPPPQMIIHLQCPVNHVGHVKVKHSMIKKFNNKYNINK